jgi:competence protein ComEC
VIRFEARLMPPAPPIFPGAYNFARTAWFAGLSASGTATSPVKVLSKVERRDWLAQARAALSRHIRGRLEGSASGIAAALATGDRGGIAEDDAEAMRDAGLAHLLSTSGLHVSAVIGTVYLLSRCVSWRCRRGWRCACACRCSRPGAARWPVSAIRS